MRSYSCRLHSSGSMASFLSLRLLDAAHHVGSVLVSRTPPCPLGRNCLQSILNLSSTRSGSLLSTGSTFPARTICFASSASKLHQGRHFNPNVYIIRQTSSEGGPFSAKSNKTALFYICAIGIFMTGMSYAGVPLYRMFCQVIVFINSHVYLCLRQDALILVTQDKLEKNVASKNPKKLKFSVEKMLSQVCLSWVFFVADCIMQTVIL